MKHTKFYILSILTISFFAGCTGPVEYGDPNAADPISENFSLSDVNIMAERMAESMLSSPATVRITKDEQPLLVIANIRNETDQHINLTALTDVVKTKVIRSGLFAFVDKAARDAIEEEVSYQRDTGNVRKDTATERGRQLGADYLLTGKLVSYNEQSGSKSRKAYKLFMNLTNLESSVIVWADEQNLSKERKRGLFGG